MAANGRFVQDVTIPDDTKIAMGSSFTKTWVVQNNGDVPWGVGFSFVWVGGEAMTTQTCIPLPAAAPGQQVQISLNLTAPGKEGKQFTDWRFQDSSGRFFGDIIYARILCTRPLKNDSYFQADLSIPDGTPIPAGTAFTKTWRIRNSGDIPWGAGYTLAHVEGTLMAAVSSIPVPNVAAGQDVNLSVELKAPTTPGSYHSDWQLRDPQGNRFGARFWLQIFVPPPVTATPSTTPAPVGMAAPVIAPIAAPTGAAGVPTPVGMAAPTPMMPKTTLAPHFSQRDPRWSNIPLANLGGAPTIGRWGCMMTCLTMTANTHGHATTPDQFNRDMVARGGFVNGYFTRWDALSVVYPDIAFEGKVDLGQGDLISKIDDFLLRQRPVPVLVDNTPQTAYSDVDQHWVLVVGRNGNDFLINDPYPLTPEPISLLGRYGRAGGTLTDAVRSALFYRK